MKTLIPNQFEMSLIRDEINRVVFFEQPERDFPFIAITLPCDILVSVDVKASCLHDRWGSIYTEVEITDAVAVNGYNKEFTIDIVGHKIH